jgi:sulfoacetaldehyde dehydrogenase
MSTDTLDVSAYVAELISRARKAQKIAETFDQKKADELATAIVWEIVANEQLVRELAELAWEETKLGDIPSKITKVSVKCRGVLFDIKHEKSVGIVEEIPERGLIRIAKPVGVIGSLVPSTQPEMHPLIQAIFAAKARDAVIFSPHPSAKKTTTRTVELIRNVMKKYGAPEDLFISIPNPTLAITNELMKQVDLIIATGGQPMVRAAYSSGTPAFGVGAGNAVIYVDKSANIKEAASKIKTSKTFDLAAGCSCDNSVVIHEEIYDEMLAALAEVGGHMLNAEEKAKLQKVIWPNWPNDHVINREVVAKPVEVIAKLADIQVPEGTAMLLVEETGSGEQYPFSGEKLCLAVAVYKAKDVDDAIRIINANHAYSGAGHSCGIYTNTPENVEKVALKTYTTRVVVNLPQSATNTGSWVSGMPFTSSLGCGTWGGNIVSENIALKHYLNNTWVIREIPNRAPTDEELFSGFVPR